MPSRRTNHRRPIPRPIVTHDDFDDEADWDPAPSRFLVAAPWIALLALAAAAGAIVLVLMNRGTDLSACRSAAWAAIPDKHDLPANWALGSTDLNANGMTVSINGPASADDSTAQPIAYASVTCYGEVAATAMQENRDAAKAAGSTVVDRLSGGDAYDVVNPSTGSVTTLFRVGTLIGQIADAGSSSSADLAQITKAVAAAMGDQAAAGSPGARPSGATGSETPGGSGSAEGGSPGPSGSPVAPDLEAKLPTEVGGTTLTTQSATADSVFGDDPNSRALSARIRAMGSDVTDLQIAQAFDESSTIDLSIVAFRLPGKDAAKLRAAVVDTWLSANVEGVKQSEVTLGGKRLTKIDYGDAGPLDYVYRGSDYVIVIDTADPAIAAEAAQKIK
jgi:hypothetical protein